MFLGLGLDRKLVEVELLSWLGKSWRDGMLFKKIVNDFSKRLCKYVIWKSVLDGFLRFCSLNFFIIWIIYYLNKMLK